MLRFDIIVHVISYMAISCIVSQIEPDIGRVENREIYIPPVFNAPGRNFAKMFCTWKTRM